MENVSKALLIAAGVLIVILIITISLKILDYNNDVTQTTDKVGENISESVSDSSKKAIYVLEDLNGKSVIKVKQHTADAASNKYYSSYFPQNPKILLKPNTTYMLSFNYKVEYADYNVGCGIGCGEKAYVLDIVTLQKYYYTSNPSKKEGTFKHTFKTKRRRDPDNYVPKFFLDAMVSSKMIIDDSLNVIKQLNLICEYGKEDKVEITVFPYHIF